MSASVRFIRNALVLSTLVALPTFVSAQQSASIFLVNADTQPLVGSIVGTVQLCNPSSGDTCTNQGIRQNQATTTYQIQCLEGTDSSECGFPDPFTYVKEGMSSIQYTMSFGAVTAMVECSLGGTTTALCTASSAIDSAAAYSGQTFSDEGPATVALGPEEISFTQIPITGAVATAPQSTGAAAATATPAGASNERMTATAPTTAGGGSATGQSEASPSSSTGGTISLESRSIVALVLAAAFGGLII
ncbi:MAG: hypothetical protein LQ341_000086 [Variospora aurantia]|nr:MAG: hypothetical protein LQ341_000086 [Variospora aurantia]